MNCAECRRKAFTLIEVVLVILILAMLAGASIVGYTKIKERADRDLAVSLVGQAADAVDMFRLHLNRYPTDEEGLQALVQKPDDEKEAEKWSGPYLKNGVIPVDPWNNELKYQLLTSSGDEIGPPFRVFSYGPDGQEGTEDDISSVKQKTDT